MTAPARVPFVPATGLPTGGLPPPPPPPAGTPAPNITVEVAFTSAADEANPAWEDLAATAPGGVLPLYAGNTSRGRQYELDDIAAGQLTLTLDNADAAYTPGNVSGRHYPNVRVDKQVRVIITPPAPNDIYAAPISRGFITSWNADLQGGYEASQTAITATDNTDGLSLIDMKSDFATELLALNPWGYWPAGEPDGATAIGDISGNSRAPLPLRSFIGTTDIAGTFKFGADPITPSDAATSLTLTPILIGSSTDSGWYLEIPTTGAQGVPLRYGDGFSIALAFRTNAAPSSAMSLIELDDATGNNLVQVFVGGTLPGSTFNARLEAFFFPGGAGSGDFWNSLTAFNDGRAHLLVLVVRSDAQHLDVYVDGTRRGTVTLAAPAPNTVVDGRFTIGVGTGVTTTGFPWLGDLGKPAVFTHALSATQIARLWQGWLGFPGEDADDRILRYLGYAAWPGGTLFEDATTVLGLQQVETLDALAAIKQAAASEQGQFFIGPDGTARFQSRKHRVNAPSRVTFDSSLPVDRSGLVFTEDRSFIRNDITGTRPGGTTQRVTDAQSIKDHRRRTDELDLAVLTDNELYSALSWRLLRYKDADVRVGSIVLDPYTHPQLWRWVLGLEIGDRVTLDDLPPTAPATTMEFYVESIAHAFTPSSFKTTLQLSPADNWKFWRLGAPGYSTLGVSTRLGY